MNDREVGRFVSAIDSDSHESKKICLCGKNSPHAARVDCIVAGPKTPWWNAFADAEPGELVTVRLPGRDVHLVVQEIEPILADLAA